jgi:hypothetical protein
MTNIDSLILEYLHRNDNESVSCMDTTKDIIKAVQQGFMPAYDIELALARLKEKGSIKAHPVMVSEKDVYLSALEWEGCPIQSEPEAVIRDVVQLKKA